MEYKYVIIGAGNGGQSLAGDMVLRGTKVSAIYDKNPAPDSGHSGGRRHQNERSGCSGLCPD